MIKITSRGFVSTSRGRIMAPILRPYRESIDKIFDMLAQSPKPTIIEVLPNGRTVELTTSNFDKDNELSKPIVDPKNFSASINEAERREDANKQVPNHDKSKDNNQNYQGKGNQGNWSNNGSNKKNKHGNKNKGNNNSDPQQALDTSNVTTNDIASEQQIIGSDDTPISE